MIGGAIGRLALASFLALGFVFGSPRNVAGRSVLSPEPTLPDGATVVTPIPDDYRRWWKNVEQCSGKHLNIDDVLFFRVPASSPRSGGMFWFDERSGVGTVGYTYERPKAIAMAEAWLHDSASFSHEALHAIASPNGHDPKMYLVLCHHVVECNRFCINSPPS